MKSITKLASFLATAFLFRLGSASSISAQVDLVFPRNNTVYQPVYPFPIVYAIHNFSKVWQYQPTVSLTLIEINLETTQRLSYSEGVVGFDSKKTQPSWAPPPDTFLAINSSSNPSRSNQSSWILQHSFNINALNCAGMEYRPT